MIKLLLVFIITSWISSSDACDCMPIVKKDAFCKSTFAGIIKVLNSGSSCQSKKICYSIGVVQRLSGKSISPTVLRTSDNSASCGVTLIKGNTYFVATDAIDFNTLGLNSCQHKENWSKISASQRSVRIQEYRQIVSRCSGIA